MQNLGTFLSKWCVANDCGVIRVLEQTCSLKPLQFDHMKTTKTRLFLQIKAHWHGVGFYTVRIPSRFLHLAVTFGSIFHVFVCLCHGIDLRMGRSLNWLFGSTWKQLSFWYGAPVTIPLPYLPSAKKLHKSIPLTSTFNFEWYILFCLILSLKLWPELLTLLIVRRVSSDQKSNREKLVCPPKNAND